MSTLFSPKRCGLFFKYGQSFSPALCGGILRPVLLRAGQKYGTPSLRAFPGSRAGADRASRWHLDGDGDILQLPAGALSDIIGRKRTMLIGLAVFVPFLYLFIRDYSLLVTIRFLHGFATATYGPVYMAVVMDIAGSKKGEMLSWFSSITIIG